MSGSSRWSDLKLRLSSAVVLVAVAGACLWQGGMIYNALILLAMFGLVWEGETLIRQPLPTWRGILLLCWPLVSGVAALRGEWSGAFWMVWPSLVFGVPACIPVIVSILGGLSLLWLRHLPAGFESVLFVLCVVIASDSFAYLSGRIFGGPKLAPSISPGKTRSGAIGGLVGASLAGGAVAWLSGLGFVGGGLVWGAVLGVFSQSGDLIESAAKRRLGVKDSGVLIPGHGGLLDRFDGLLAAAPLAALLSLAAFGQVFWSVTPADLVGGSAHHTIPQGSSSHD
ncbi:phosphatidate cytidylyltransferase [Gluconobacter japonicus]|uniref:Phosphatidate cytidylyltransferase n=1 Tax=Gluconobacter japonicus TaxID=376620 RepID=A0ABQ5WER7_GLUJA|nr:phosphatidate cytidylyltransferase [Gluconobacter japonicus]KXV27518.1 phosphatidate cytidylyltransferase [Gluconobacter japonicus]GBR18460.1 phosphatidate cytidylyltransferase [Gluconobacter japonicus NBRC 3271]GLQ58622.1 phosphatidate cytidylyltransferase [Gluconobacter japonicus]